MKRPCPGVGMIAPSPLLDYSEQPCPMCGRDSRVADDGTIAHHRMRYAAIVEHLAQVVTSLERGPWEPIWARPQLTQ